jgi:hypothetical protein
MGDIPFETSPNLSVFSKIWFGSRSQRLSSRNHSGLTSSRPRFRHSSDVSSVVRVPLYHPSPVARSGSRCRFPRTALVPSLLLEDCPSVKKNTTPQTQQCQGVWLILCCANAVKTVELPGNPTLSLYPKWRISNEHSTASRSRHEQTECLYWAICDGSRRRSS